MVRSKEEFTCAGAASVGGILQTTTIMPDDEKTPQLTCETMDSIYNEVVGTKEFIGDDGFGNGNDSK